MSGVVEDLLYIQLFIAHIGDGELDERELDFMEDCLVVMGARDRKQAKQLLVRKKDTYLEDMAKHPAEAVAGFQQRVDRMSATFDGQRDVLAHLYQDLVRLTSMDGHQGHGEQTLLAGIRKDWNL